MKLLLLVVFTGDDSREVRGQAGHSVTLLCHYDVKTHSLLSVCWNRGKLPLSGCKDLLIAVDQLRVREDTRVSSRYQLWGRLDEGDVSLTILNLTETDAGLYGCRVEIPGWLNDEKHNFHLTVDSGHLTTTGRALTSSSSSISASSSVTAAVGGVVFALIVMLTAGGVVVVARKWRRLNKVRNFTSRQFDLRVGNRSVSHPSSHRHTSTTDRFIYVTVIQASSSLGSVASCWCRVVKLKPRDRRKTTRQISEEQTQRIRHVSLTFQSTRRQQQLVDTSVQFTCGGSAAENIYQIDGGEYEFCP
ncbi:hypothetical protein F2P81_024772 [Scophthalmus maximus]|uniref:Ig-like domain-containing protein n=1 Tax=Scophthalmus maximus TaxID=52904 RepID=A0A6A4RUE8_SCOMX|nr:hypothetical protein F2P81_024772 [Scophthalmus maximus]